MFLNKLESSEIKIVYLYLAKSFGFYRIRPGKDPYICLSTKLLEGSEEFHRKVYRLLLEQHRAIPDNSIYRAFPMHKHVEELMPPEEVALHTVGPGSSTSGCNRWPWINALKKGRLRIFSALVK